MPAARAADEHRISRIGRTVYAASGRARSAVRSLQPDAYIMDALQAAHNDAIAATKTGDGWKEGRGSRDARTLQRLHLVFRKKIFLDPEEEENHWAVRELIACQALATFNEAWIMPTAEQCLEVMAWHLRLRYGDVLPADMGYGRMEGRGRADDPDDLALTLPTTARHGAVLWAAPQGGNQVGDARAHAAARHVGGMHGAGHEGAPRPHGDLAAPGELS